MHITEKLHKDHEKVDRLFSKLLDTTSGAEKTRTDLFAKLREELEAHTEFEENVFYPAVRGDSNDAEELVDVAEEEHAQVDKLLEELSGMDATSDEFLDRLKLLKQAVQEHVEREEGDIFPIARDLLDKQDAEQMSGKHDRMVQEHRSQAAQRA